jgi:ABC-2 type transport system ATP-binding protein
VVEPVLSVRGLHKRYGAREALRAIDFDLRPGELVAVVGPNGAGKTTLLSILAGVQRQSAGTVLAGPGLPGGRRAIGWAPQQPALYGRLSVQENLRLFARLERVADVEAAVRGMLEHTGLQARARELAERLSGGNRQRMNVALALIASPRVLMLDEPSSALDPGQRERLWEFITSLLGRAADNPAPRGGGDGDIASADLGSGRTGASELGTCVLFSTHHLGEAHRYATRALVLADGELLFDGPPDELIVAHGGEGDLEQAFVAFLGERGHR